MAQKHRDEARQTAAPESVATQGPVVRPDSLLDRHRWLVFAGPLLVYLIVGSLEPSPNQAGGRSLGLSISYDLYPWLYSLKIALTAAAVALVWPGYREFRQRPGVLAVLVGVVGVILWIGLWKLAIDQKILSALGLGSVADLGTRPAFNPWDRLSGSPAALYGFLAVRFLGLAVIVPVIEEFFLRGFVMRAVMDADWWKIPFGQVNSTAVAASLIVPAVMHPAELLPAIAWFGLVTWLMVKTRNPWDCVLAHAVTNLLLGVYVVTTGTWALW